MSRKVFDGIASDAAAIGRLARPGDVVLYYADGRYAWPAEAVTHFETAAIELVAITVLGDPRCGIWDDEIGDKGSARGYARGRRSLGHMPTIYCDLATLPSVRERCAGLDYDVYVADWTGRPHEVPGTVGTQYLPGATHDTGIIYDDGWHPQLAARAAVVDPVREPVQVPVPA
jgi:hypothetical protein